MLPTRIEEPEESAAEKIYATLRECREQADPKKQKGVLMQVWSISQIFCLFQINFYYFSYQGYLLKKKEKLGKWKQLYFVLKQDGADTHLYFYDHPKRTKPKGLIDLSCAFLYSVHESFFDKRFCFQLVERALPCLATVTYLGAEDAGDLEDWLSALKPLCVPQMVRLYFCCSRSPPAAREYGKVGCQKLAQVPVLTAYFPMLAQGTFGKGGLFVAPPLEDCFIRLTALLPELKQVVPIYSLSVAVLATAKH